MEKSLNVIFIVALTLNISCTDHQSVNTLNNNFKEVSFISLNIFPSLSSKSLIVINFSDSLFLLNPFGISSLNLPTTPAPPSSEKSYDSTIYDEDIKVLTEVGKLTTNQLDSLQILINNLQENDFNPVYNFINDGMATRLDIVYRNGETNNIIQVNSTSENQIKLLKYLLKVISDECKLNRDYLLRIGPG